MTVQFENVPGNLRVPLWFAEFNAAQSPYQSISRLLLCGQIRAGTITSAAKSGGNTGGGTLTLDATTPRLPGAIPGVYAVRITATASNAGTFQVTNPRGVVLGTGTVGGAAFANEIKFTMADVGTDFDVGDGFDITVSPYGVAEANQPIQVTGNEDTLFGPGSMLSEMYKIARRNAPFQEIWALPLADDNSGVKAAGKFTINGVVSQSGTMTVYIGTKRVRVAVSTADSAIQIATRLVAAINAVDGVPVVATQGAGPNNEVVLTAIHKGALGNKILLHTDYVGDEGPLQTMIAITAMTGGSGDPELATAFANLGDEEYDFIAGPYCDVTNLGHVYSTLNGVSGRWSPIRQLYGGYFTAKDDTNAALSTFGNTLNDPHVSVMGYYKSPSAPWEWAAAYAAKAAQHLSEPPELSRPLHSLVMEGIKPAKRVGDRFDMQVRQTLYYDGIACSHVRRSGEVCIDRAVTTYQSNPWGMPDASLLDVETLYQGAYSIRYLKTKVTGVWGRAALRDEDPFGIQGVATPDRVRDTIVHGYRELSALNVVENEDLFESLLIVERNQVDPNRLDIFLPIDHVNQLRVIAVNVTSHLQFNAAAAA